MTPCTARRRRTAVLLAGSLALTAGAAGCADVDGLRSDGRIDEVTKPLSLWRDSRPAPAAPGQQPGKPAPVPGVPEVPSGDMRDADPLAVVQADFAAAGEQDGGSGRLVDQRAVRLLAECSGQACPVRPPVLHDLTGDGKAELITAVDVDGRTSELRVYTVEAGRVTRVLARRAVLEGVEVAAGHLAVREPTSNPVYVSVSDYVWDGKGAMALDDLSLDECRAPRTGTGTGDEPCPRADR
ncbi:hypothetical protein [Streptomyces luteolus]|uniref:Lipoprotein n=1 Tax=Streptomyces luteolus TaxID=3043615 RepID=A0ABT6T0G0_9ACTN|nr:hypothetical protein [Streptomyces sp. B-S-A12]MDI3420940.1 hypothetical protein [Streptomyces sp. B-S-A12]